VNKKRERHEKGSSVSKTNGAVYTSTNSSACSFTYLLLHCFMDGCSIMLLNATAACREISHERVAWVFSTRICGQGRTKKLTIHQYSKHPCLPRRAHQPPRQTLCHFLHVQPHTSTQQKLYQHPSSGPIEDKGPRQSVKIAICQSLDRPPIKCDSNNPIFLLLLMIILLQVKTISSQFQEVLHAHCGKET
jgi:hypothetical protein